MPVFVVGVFAFGKGFTSRQMPASSRMCIIDVVIKAVVTMQWMDCLMTCG
jgi:hypothetical protein